MPIPVTPKQAAVSVDPSKHRKAIDDRGITIYHLPGELGGQHQVIPASGYDDDDVADVAEIEARFAAILGRRLEEAVRGETPNRRNPDTAAAQAEQPEQPRQGGQ